MFGGVAFMIKDKMCIGVLKDEIILRVMDEHNACLLDEKHVKPMQFTGRTLKGFLFIEEPGIEKAKDLLKWIKLGIEFSEKAVLKSKNKKKA